MTEETPYNNTLNNYQIAGLVILSFYVLGVFFPNLFWSSHFLAFFPTPIKLAVLLTSFGLIFTKPERIREIDLSSNLQIILITLVYASIIYAFPILFDHYGDAYKFDDAIAKVQTTIPQKAHDALFSLEVGPTTGHYSILAIVTYISYYLEITINDAFHWVGIICGAGFVFIWQIFVRYISKATTNRLLLLLAGLTAPFLLIFFGHKEIYAPIFLVHTAWLMYLVYFLDLPSKRKFIILAILWILCLKLHPAAVLYIPVLIIAALRQFKSNGEDFLNAITFKKLFKWIVLPFAGAGLFVYFFVVKDYNDPRTLEEYIDPIERLFLPLFSPKAPLDRYNLFSFEHLFDLLVLPLMWSPIAILLIATVAAQLKKQINFNQPVFRLITLVFVLNLLLFFATNPILSLPIDWDLFCIPAMSMLVLTGIILRETEDTRQIEFNKIVPVSLALTVVILPFFALHQYPKMTSDRYIALANRVYDSYYEWTFQILDYAMEIPENGYDNDYEFREAMIKDLRPRAILEDDKEFAALIADQGRSLLRDSANPQAALVKFEEAVRYDNNLPKVSLLAMEAYFSLGLFDEAYWETELLRKKNYPSEQKALSISIHCAIEAREYDDALKYTTSYLEKWESDVIQEVHTNLKNKTNLRDLKKYFKAD